MVISAWKRARGPTNPLTLLSGTPLLFELQIIFDIHCHSYMSIYLSVQIRIELLMILLSDTVFKKVRALDRWGMYVMVSIAIILVLDPGVTQWWNVMSIITIEKRRVTWDEKKKWVGNIWTGAIFVSVMGSVWRNGRAYVSGPKSLGFETLMGQLIFFIREKESYGHC